MIVLKSVEGVIMEYDSIALRVASRHVDSFGQESDLIMALHYEAMECLDCEAFLKLGIDAYQWIIDADRDFRKAICKSPESVDFARIEAYLNELCRAWISRSEEAVERIKTQMERGHIVGNAAEFFRCREEMNSIVRFGEAWKNEPLVDAMAALAAQAAKEHADGETAEFV
jgi:hypothetical protein